MKRVFAVVALSAALMGCQSMQRELFGPPAPATPTRTTPITSTPVPPPTASSQPVSTSNYTYAPAAAPVATYTTQPYAAQPYVTAPTGAPIDLSQRPMDAGQRTLLDADRTFSELVLARGLSQAVAAVADPEGTMLITSNTAGSLNLIPEKATLSNSQDFGQTSGRFVQVLTSGAAVQGRYITVWRKYSTGWRVLSYASTVNPARAATAAAAPARRR